MADDQGGVLTYVVHNPITERVKIGRTRHLRKRLAALRTMAGTELHLVGTLPDDSEHSLHARFRAHRCLGEWFAVEPELAAWVRTCFGYRLHAARERRPRPPAPDVQDVALGLEALAGLALREPELVDLLDYLAAEFGPDSPRARAEAAEKPDTDAEPEDEETEWAEFDEAVWPVVGPLEQWESQWIGWLAPAAFTLDAQWLDCWLAFWRPVNEPMVRRLRQAMAWAAIASDHDLIEPLRLRPVLVNRKDGSLEPLPPDELY